MTIAIDRQIPPQPLSFDEFLDRSCLTALPVGIIIALGMAKEGFDWIRCEHALTIGYRR